MAVRTERQLERAWEKYVAGTKRDAARIRRRARAPRITTIVQSRAVTVVNKFGKRIKTKWGKWENWNQAKSQEVNIKLAIANALTRLRGKRVGTIIYLRTVVNGLASKTVTPIYEAKWGNDGLPFVQWKPNPVADRLRRAISLQ